MIRWLLRATGWCSVLMASLVVVVAVVLPRLTGATPFTVMTGSMQPSLPAGTLVVVRPVDPTDIRVGAVVTYQLRSGESTTATHRVVAQSHDPSGRPLFQTQGDANAAPDSAWVRPEQVRGELWYSVPWVGHLSALLDSDQRELGARGVGGLLAGYALLLAVRAALERRRARAAEPVGV